MTTVTSADRILAWNIQLLECPPGNERIAGSFQTLPPHQPSLTWGDLYDDLCLCFELDHVRAPPVGALALWFRGKSRHPSISRTNGQPAPCVYLDHSISASYNSGEVLSQYINVATEDGNGSDDDDVEDLNGPLLDLTLVIHDPESCSVTSDDLADHLSNHCAMPIQLIRNKKFHYLPIPGAAGSFSSVTTASQTPKTSSRNSPNKRLRIDPSSVGSVSSSTKRDSTSRRKFIVPSELELNVKKLYNGTCVITRNNTSWGRHGGISMISGPGIEACHIFPKSMFKWYPLPNKEDLTDQALWNAVNSTSNCMVMDSLAHSVYDNRLLAVHPFSHRVRLFAPVNPLLYRNHEKAYFRHNPPSAISLKWHYEMTVFENMCALVLEKEGGTKRVPWREGPVSFVGEMEELVSETIQNVDRSRTTEEDGAKDEPPNALHNGVTDAADELCPSISFDPSSRSTRSSSFSDIRASPHSGAKRNLAFEISNSDCLSTFSHIAKESIEKSIWYLYRRLEEEAALQNNLMSFEEWSADRKALRRAQNKGVEYRV